MFLLVNQGVTTNMSDLNTPDGSRGIVQITPKCYCGDCSFEYPLRQLGDVSDPTYLLPARLFPGTPENNREAPCSLDLNDPPAAAGGIPKKNSLVSYRLDLNLPPAAAGGIHGSRHFSSFFPPSCGASSLATSTFVPSAKAKLPSITTVSPPCKPEVISILSLVRMPIVTFVS